MLKIAITGNIASGKSLFEKFLKDKGFKVLCLDNVTHSLYENSPRLREFLLKKFNTVNRIEVADIVFNNSILKKELEDFIYPLILDEMNNFFKENLNKPFVFVSAALLFEAGFDKYFDKIVLICADENIRIKRLMARNSISKAEAKLRIDSQMKEDFKKEHADYVIDNSGTKEEFKDAVDVFINMFLEDLKAF